MTAKNSGIEPFPFAFPPQPGSSHVPVWTGRGFRIGDRETAVLSYEVGQSGWTDELTGFQDDTSGEDHYIERASREHTLTQLRRWLGTDQPVIIDIGCSNGLMLKPLRLEFPGAAIIGADYVSGLLETLAQNLDGVPLVQFDLTSCPLPDNSVDAVILLNVLEHIERDDAALSHVARILKPDGIAIVEVPAGRQLYDIYDKVLLHHRRYSMQELLDKVSSAGMQVLEKSHLGFFMYPPFWAVKKRNQRYLDRSPEIQKRIVSRTIKTARSHPLLHRIMDAEAHLRKLVYYPFGIRCLVTCRPIR
jgi:SAM-dependent methyltransferase